MRQRLTLIDRIDLFIPLSSRTARRPSHVTVSSLKRVLIQFFFSPAKKKTKTKISFPPISNSSPPSLIFSRLHGAINRQVASDEAKRPSRHQTSRKRRVNASSPRRGDLACQVPPGGLVSFFFFFSSPTKDN